MFSHRLLCRSSHFGMPRTPETVRVKGLILVLGDVLILTMGGTAWDLFIVPPRCKWLPCFIHVWKVYLARFPKWLVA